MTLGRRPSDLWIWLILPGLFGHSSCQSVSSSFENKTAQDEGKPRVFSPRMDYDEWTPLGRGDPLKNNPTFDYVPPVLDRVQYWLDSHTTEPSAKRDILVLGVTAKKTSPKIPEQFLKFVDGPKFTRSNHQDVSYRNEFTGSTGAEPPKVVRTSSFRNDYRNQNRIQPLSSYYPSPYYGQKSKPYTMMLPPPLAQKDKIASFAEPTRQFNTQTEEGPVLQEPQFYAPVPPQNYNQQLPARTQAPAKFSPNKSPVQTVSQVETIKIVYAPPLPQATKHEGVTAPSVSFEKSNLIYQSTQTLSGGWPLNSNAVHLSTPIASIVGQPTTRLTPDYSRDQYEIDHHVAASSNHEVVVEQNANIIVEGESSEKEEVVVGQKGALQSSEAAAPTAPPTATILSTSFPSASSSVDEKVNASGGSPASHTLEKMHIVVANTPGNEADDPEMKKGPVAVITPTNYSGKTSNGSSRETLEPSGTREVVTTVAPETSTAIENDGPREHETRVVDSSTTTGAPVFSEVPQLSSVIGVPNRMVPPQQHGPSTISPLPSRHSPDSTVAFSHPQAPLSSMMHSQPRPNHAPVHYLGSMRPNIDFRAPASMPMFPPMTHMRAPPPVRSTLTHMLAPQSQQDFSAVFTVSPAPSAAPAQTSGSRAPGAASIFTTPTAAPFLPTVPSALENSPLAARDGHAGGPGTGDRSPLKEEPEEGGKSVAPSSSTSHQVTTVSSLTTDPIFSHYKQPAKPIRGPMYLIIQGHSKVKTYKPTVSKHSAAVEGNEIVESVGDGRLSKFEQFVRENTRSNDRASAAAVEKRKAEERARVEKLARVRQSDLMSLVESGIESFTVSPARSTTEDERRTNTVTAIEINAD